MAEYETWWGMIRRCSPGSSNPYYAGRGIRVCARWRRSFNAFLADMGTKPNAKSTLDRIDGNKGYYPGNCRWASRKEQTRNTNRRRYITAFGETKRMYEWLEDPCCAVNRPQLHWRLKAGWPPEEALIKSVLKRARS